MDWTDLLNIIISRRSIRKYLKKDLPGDIIETILEAGRWAPSGLNNQPWRFSVIRNTDVKNKLSILTNYSRIVKECNVCIALFYDVSSGYNRDKDLMGIGACIQNMLLSAHSLGVGTVWLGEILKSKAEFAAILGIEDNYELAAVIALGYPDESPKSSRKSMDTLRLKDFP